MHTRAARTVDAVVLDAGGVLLLPDPEAVRRQLAPFGVCPSDEECVRAHYVGMAVVDAQTTGDFIAANRAIARYLGVDQAVSEQAGMALADAYGSPWIPAPGVAEQLRRLSEAGVRLAVVSNATGNMEAELARHGLCAVGGAAGVRGLPEVVVVVDSGVVGVEKPDPAIFTYALDALGVPAARCLYVGDSVHFDVNGATAAGLRPVHITSMDCQGRHPHYGALGELVDCFFSGSAGDLWP
jgi:putative hydrolase of the HAD superfamily